MAGAGRAIVVAYLVGTNVAALATPHGSLATILCRAGATERGHDVPRSRYLRHAWRYAAAGTLAAIAAVILVG